MLQRQQQHTKTTTPLCTGRLFFFRATSFIEKTPSTVWIWSPVNGSWLCEYAMAETDRLHSGGLYYQNYRTTLQHHRLCLLMIGLCLVYLYIYICLFTLFEYYLQLHNTTTTVSQITPLRCSHTGVSCCVPGIVHMPSPHASQPAAWFA